MLFSQNFKRGSMLSPQIISIHIDEYNYQSAMSLFIGVRNTSPL